MLNSFLIGHPIETHHLIVSVPCRTHCAAVYFVKTPSWAPVFEIPILPLRHDNWTKGDVCKIYHRAMVRIKTKKCQIYYAISLFKFNSWHIRVNTTKRSFQGQISTKYRSIILIQSLKMPKNKKLSEKPSFSFKNNFPQKWFWSMAEVLKLIFTFHWIQEILFRTIKY